MDARRNETADENMSSGSFNQCELFSARRSISPPSRKRHKSSHLLADSTKDNSHVPHDSITPQQGTKISSLSSSVVPECPSTSINISPSPVQLVAVRDLPSSCNIDTISLKDILGQPLIKECWIFNYLFDIDFVMEQFDEDTRDLVRVHIVHGSWKTEDGNRRRIDEAAKRFSNVQPVAAYMPEAYGTHHSKMIVLLRHDDLAQVVIMTANMLAQDWRMCQAVWRSPLLPLKASSDTPAPLAIGTPRIGTGARFKRDLLAYLGKYEKRTKDLVAQLNDYDFGNVRAALIASTPCKVNVRSGDPEKEILWGWPALKRILGGIPTTSSEPQIVIQVSSIASIGEKWLSTTFFEALSASASSPKPKPKVSIVFPTGDEIRRSIDGYSAGSSIHMKTQSAAQLKQLTYMKPMLCHWAGDDAIRSGSEALAAVQVQEAGRRRAAPHIKTYLRFRDHTMTKIDWAMMTSANLSTQAWGGASNAAGEVRICSYEIGVVVWPGLWDEGEPGSAEMVPVFKMDIPSTDESTTANDKADGKIKTRVGWRMPYDLPLVPYQKGEMPWCANEPCSELDWMGRTWPGFNSG